MHSPGRQLRLGMAAMTYLIALLVITHIPMGNFFSDSLFNWDVENWEQDKLAHAAAYAILAALFTALPLVRMRAEADESCDTIIGESEICQVGVIAAILAGVGLIDELTQPIFGRSFTVDDWIADLIGIAIGQAIATAICMGVKRSSSEFVPID
jgi:hypothetical protein